MRITIDTGDNEQSPIATSRGGATTPSLTDHDGGPAAPSIRPDHPAAATAPAEAMTVYDGGAAKAEFDALIAAAGDEVVSQFSGGEHKDLHGVGGERALDGGPAAGEAPID
jgi:hypothetical protein